MMLCQESPALVSINESISLTVEGAGIAERS